MSAVVAKDMGVGKILTSYVIAECTLLMVQLHREWIKSSLILHLLSTEYSVSSGNIGYIMEV